MLSDVHNSRSASRVDVDQPTSQSNRPDSPMRSDLKMIGSAEMSAMHRSNLRLMVKEGRYPIPIWDPGKSHYDPNARSAVTHGTSSAHYSSDPFLSAQRFAACASPSLRHDPNSAWARHVADCKEYLRLSSPTPPPRNVQFLRENPHGCCTLL